MYRSCCSIFRNTNLGSEVSRNIIDIFVASGCHNHTDAINFFEKRHLGFGGADICFAFVYGEIVVAGVEDLLRLSA